MAETLSELLVKIKADATELERGLTNAERQTEASSKKMADSLKQVGMGMAATGAAITASLGMMVKSFAGTGSELHDLSLKTGVSVEALAGLKYAAEQNGASLGTVEMALKRVSMAMSGADDDAEGTSKAFNKIGMTLKDLEGLNPEQQFLKIANAIAQIPDPMTRSAAAVSFFGRSGTDMLPMLSQGADGLKKMMEEGVKLTGWTDEGANSADALGDAFSTLKTATMGIFNAIGSSLAPVLKDLAGSITGLISKIIGWTKEHPALTKTLTLVALGIGAVLTVVGGLILAMPIITSMIAAFGVVFHVALGPIGLISLAIAGLIAAGIALWKNWDKVKKFFANMWDNIKIIFAKAIKFLVNTILAPFLEYYGKIFGFITQGIGKLVGIFNKELGKSIENVGEKLKNARKEISNWADSLEDSAKASKAFRQTEEDVKKLTGTIKEEFDKQASEIQVSYDKQREESKKAYDDAVDTINKEYGIGETAKEVSETKIDAAKRATAKIKEQYKREEDAAKDRYDSEMQRIRDVYDAKLAALDIETDATIKALQDQIDAIDAQTEAEDLANTRAEEKQKLGELKAAYDSAGTAEDKAEAKKEWDEYAAEVARNELLRTRNEEKNALRDQIEEARERAESRREQIQAEEDATLASLKTKYEAEIETYTLLAEAADKDLEEELARIEVDRLAALQAESDKYDATITRLADSEKADIEFFANQLKNTNAQIVAINTAYNALTKRYDIEIVTHQITVYEGKTPTPPKVTIGPQKGYATGGIVPGPIGMPQLATVHGGETIIPANESMGNIVINFTQPVFFAREDDMNRFVDKISRTLDRKYRLGGRL